MNRPVLALAAFLVLANAAQAADARATLGAVKGEVLVGSGAGLAPAKAGSPLKAGDRIIVRSGATTIRFADGCERALSAGGMATIADKSPCAGGPGLVQAADATSAQFIKLPQSPGAYVASAGVLVIVGALIYAVTGVSE